MSQCRPNIVLVSMDSLRGDHCGFLGSRRGLTPTMDELAAEGVNYRTAVAPGPQTFSSMPAVFTGQPRPVEDLRRYSGETHWQRRLAAINEYIQTTPSFPERLRELGYTTGAITPNPWTSSPAGFDRGFDRFVDLSSEGADESPSLLERVPGIDTDDRAVKLAVDLLTGSSFFSRWEDLYGGVSQLRAELSEPYFLWVFLLDTHYPFLTTRRHRKEQSLIEMYLAAYRSEGLMRGRAEDGRMSPSLRESVLAGYRDTVRASDTFVARLLNDGGDDPVLIVHSDHGESFGEHGNYGHHHRDLYEENIHVPYVVHNAGVSADVTDPLSLSTLPEAVVDIGRRGTFDPGAHTAAFAVSRSECGTSRAVRGRRFKYFDSGEREMLFDLSVDPAESTNVVEEYPDVAARFREQFETQERTWAEKRELTRASRVVASSGDVTPL